MKITKFEHACLLLDNGTHRLLIDPGSFTKLPEDLSSISCVVITEEHMDHFNLNHIQVIVKQNSSVKILSTQVVAEQLEQAGIDCTPITGEAQVTVNDYILKFQESDHAQIYKSSPCKVLTIQVNNFLYYPSDSFIPNTEEVEVLALPTSGPWHKVSESVDLANSVNSKYVLATHNGLYNEIGTSVTNNFTSNNISDKARQYICLNVGESQEL